MNENGSVDGLALSDRWDRPIVEQGPFPVSTDDTTNGVRGDDTPVAYFNAKYFQKPGNNRKRDNNYSERKGMNETGKDKCSRE